MLPTPGYTACTMSPRSKSVMYVKGPPGKCLISKMSWFAYSASFSSPRCCSWDVVSKSLASTNISLRLKPDGTLSDISITSLSAAVPCPATYATFLTSNSLYRYEIICTLPNSGLNVTGGYSDWDCVKYLPSNTSNTN